MKNLKLFFYTLTLLVVLSSCTKEELSNREKIVGKWNLTGFHGTTEKKVTKNEIITISTTEMEGSDFNAFIEYTEEPNKYNNSGYFSLFMTITINGGVLEQQQVTASLTGSGTWRVDGNIITHTNQTQSSNTSSIEELTANTLRIKTNYQSEIIEDGVVTIKISEFYETFVKQ